MRRHSDYVLNTAIQCEQFTKKVPAGFYWIKLIYDFSKQFLVSYNSPPKLSSFISVH